MIGGDAAIALAILEGLFYAVFGLFATQVLKEYQPDNDLFPSYHIPKLREEAQKRFKTELKELRDAYAARQTASA